MKFYFCIFGFDLGYSMAQMSPRQLVYANESHLKTSEEFKKLENTTPRKFNCYTIEKCLLSEEIMVIDDGKTIFWREYNA